MQQEGKHSGHDARSNDLQLLLQHGPRGNRGRGADAEQETASFKYTQKADQRC